MNRPALGVTRGDTDVEPLLTKLRAFHKLEAGRDATNSATRGHGARAQWETRTLKPRVLVLILCKLCVISSKLLSLSTRELPFVAHGKSLSE